LYWLIYFNWYKWFNLIMLQCFQNLQKHINVQNWRKTHEWQTPYIFHNKKPSNKTVSMKQKYEDYSSQFKYFTYVTTSFLKAFSLNNVWANFIIFLFGDPIIFWMLLCKNTTSNEWKKLNFIIIIIFRYNVYFIWCFA